MIEFTKVYFTGDLHGKIPDTIMQLPLDKEENTAIIVLGDAGFNYYLNQKDREFKEAVAADFPDTFFYCLRGNHEQRPELVEGMERMFDVATEQDIYMEEEFPNIKYLIDGLVYNFNGNKILALGGAYSVDKFYRLSHGWNWFSKEQLTQEEMDNILTNEVLKKPPQFYDFIISHTAPYNYQPTDLFLPEIDQNTVDSTMEYWLQQVYFRARFGYWLFGHFHKNRVVINNFMYMLYDAVVDMNDILTHDVSL